MLLCTQNLNTASEGFVEDPQITVIGGGLTIQRSCRRLGVSC
jgi:hypothetical protein